ncbi:ATP-binding cassette sub-family C member 10 isoform X2 [Cylas formicarius]|uniref:ATP-binding cassette sub-family C member 10 isoform X2 n=1 Tax=Cylas formicarius TaxID=197179 RepID=UPI002958A507|nr:ATP-binding cassette sub-family C member 10 isoform X2 [Cylas formicarius]
MVHESFDVLSQWRWSWSRFCGDEEFKIWSPQWHDLNLCFQEVCLQIPILAVAGCGSAYYFGRRYGVVSRGQLSLIALKIRFIISFLLAFLPIVQIYIFLNKTEEVIPQVAYLLSGVQCLSWFTHCAYIGGLTKKLGRNPRGPTFMIVVWSMLFALSVISLKSHYTIYKYSSNLTYSIYLAYGMSVCYLVLQLAYGLTLIPGDGDSTYADVTTAIGPVNESQPLLSNVYVRFMEEDDPFYLGVAMENVGWFSRLFFLWVTPLMQKGVNDKLTSSDDLYDLPVDLSCAVVGWELDNAVRNVKLQSALHSSDRATSTSTDDSPAVNMVKRDFMLLKALHRCFWLEFYSVGILKFFADCAGFAGPMLLNRLINFIEDKSEDMKWGYVYASGLMATTMISALCDCHFNFLISMVGLRMRAALVSIIYKKTLSTNAADLNSEFSIGEIVNFMSTDTDRIVNSCPSFHSLWSIPFQLAVTLYLLYSQVGMAFFAGVLFTVILIPVNKVIANKIGTLSTKLMEQKDHRVKLITEVLRGIKAIKFYVWEEYFVRQIAKLRTEEIKYLKGRKYLDALCVYFWATTPVIISILTFGTYVLMGKTLTAATVFTSIALLNMLISPLNAFPWVLNGMTEAWVSVVRIEKFLKLPDLDLKKYYRPLEDNDRDVCIKDGEFSWNKELSTEETVKGKGVSKNSAQIDNFKNSPMERYQFQLKHINLTVNKGEFLGIIGPVGSGKSTLLSAILADISMLSGQISISQMETGFAYVSQQSWLQRGTIKDNILFGKLYNEERYRDTLFACGLVEDVTNLPAGDMTGVGESGTTLSGGQKTRIALARAVYQNKSVYLLDDVLSAVDSKVAKHIFQHCVMGMLKDKTRILCTHHMQYLVHADRIVLIEGGFIKKIGKPVDVLNELDVSIAVDAELGNDVDQSLLANRFPKTTTTGDTLEGTDEDSVLALETRETGNLDLGVYYSYWKEISHLLSLSILLSVVLMQTSRNVTDWWLAHWVTNAESNSNSTNNSQGYDVNSYLKVYVGFAVVNTLFTLLRAFLFAYGGIVAAAKFHRLLLRSMIRAKAMFFDVTPLGRILNRFSSDTYTVDDSLPFILNILLAQTFGLLGSIVITVYGLPWICLFLVPLVPIYQWLQNYYRLTSRELKRITSVTLSPVYSHFNETLQGLPTINAMRAGQRFERENKDFVDFNIKAQFASQAASRWLGLRLQFIGVVIVTGVSFIAVIQHQYDIADPGLIGLAISYALTITGLLSGVVSAFTETEREMIAVERINQYINEIPLESTYFAIDPPYGWPNQGVVGFNNVVLKYRQKLAPSLLGVTFETRPCEKVGIVGRTGSGKSTLVAALFRMAEITSGEISIDSVNINSISITALRRVSDVLHSSRPFSI